MALKQKAEQQKTEQAAQKKIFDQNEAELRKRMDKFYQEELGKGNTMSKVPELKNLYEQCVKFWAIAASEGPDAAMGKAYPGYRKAIDNYKVMMDKRATAENKSAAGDKAIVENKAMTEATDVMLITWQSVLGLISHAAKEASASEKQLIAINKNISDTSDKIAEEVASHLGFKGIRGMKITPMTKAEE